MKRSLLLVLLCGCVPEPDTPLKTSSPASTGIKLESAARFEVERVGVLSDDLAYNNRRGIYIIRDTSTGREYVGLSGVGISELGDHEEVVGKPNTTVRDER
jgi:hypothetical protein